MEEETCKWEWKGTPNGITWFTECGRYSSGFNPIVEKFEFCPYCAKKIKYKEHKLQVEQKFEKGIDAINHIANEFGVKFK